MRFLALKLLFSVASLTLAAACARPTLDDLEVAEDGGPVAVDKDAAALPPPDSAAKPAKDAGQDPTNPAPVPDAGGGEPDDAGTSCPDGDGDGRCDDEDNCPAAANPAQEDGDQDGVGDACTVATVDCEGMQVPNGVSLGNGTVRQVSINGNVGTLARVAPGEELNITVVVALESCGNLGAPSLYLGVEGSSGGQCRPGICSAVTVPVPFISFNISAPLEPGLHNLLAGLSGTAICDAPADIPIAALCVSAPK